MNIGILGAGNTGAALGKLWATAGHRVIFSVSRDVAKLTKLVGESGQQENTVSPTVKQMVKQMVAKRKKTHPSPVGRGAFRLYKINI
jgi:predicted dinucleotide-binding enzyme